MSHIPNTLDFSYHTLKFNRELPVRNKKMSSNLFLKVNYNNSETLLSTLIGVHECTLKEIEYGIRVFFNQHEISHSNISFDQLFFNMTETKNKFHPEIVFAIEAILLNSLKLSLPTSFLLTNELFDWSLANSGVAIKEKYQETQCLKIKINPKTDPLELAAIFNTLFAANEKIKIRLDANRNFEISEILFFMNTLTSKCHFDLHQRIEYLEEPLKSSNDLYSFKKILKFPYAADESVKNYMLSSSSLVDVLVIKPALFGISDIYRFMKNEQDKKIIISSCYEHPSVLQSLSFLAALREHDYHGIINELSSRN